MFERPAYLDKLVKFKDTDFIKVITGVRRSGKSVLLMLYREYLIASGVSGEKIIYINFESIEYQSIKSGEQLKEMLVKRMGNSNGRWYLLFDEIQFVEGWQIVINGVRVSFDADIVITGSNANMLSGELATLLSGRYIEIPIYPFSFREFVNAKGITISSREVDHAYLEYEKYGGFPGVIVADETIKDMILSGILDTIVLHDIAYRSGLKDAATLKGMIGFLADNVGQLVNATKIVNVLKSENVSTSSHTVNRYLDLLENGFLFYRARQYDIRGKEYLRTNGKYFIVDSGLRRDAVGRREGNLGNRLENIVYIELLRRGYRVDVGRINNKEIDFIARKVDEILYIQVTYEIPSNTHESDNLLLVKDNYKKMIITGRYHDVKQIAGVEVVYIVDWLLL